MKILAFETSTEACSVALLVDGELRERHELAPRRHATLALPWAEALLAEAGIARSQLDAIACGRGPGAFTGVRLAIALTQGIALGLDLPVVGVSTLAALAGDTVREAPVLAAIDARMGEIYLGAFDDDGSGLPRARSAETLGDPATIALPEGGPWIARGTGFAAAEAVLVRRLDGITRSIEADALPHAGIVARLAAAMLARGEAIAADALEPAYLRDKVALTLAEQGR